MSDTNRPEEQRTPEQQAPENTAAEPTNESTPEQQAPEAAPEAPPGAAAGPELPVKQQPRYDAMREEQVERLRRKQERPGKVQHLEQDPTFMPEVPAGQLDDLLERELQEAMGGMSEADLLGEMGDRRPKKPAGAAPTVGDNRRKGRVISVHGQDVFVEIPGNRSQGVLPINQFPEGKPQPGAEIDVEVEGYDRADGLLILTRRGAAVEADWSTIAEGMVVEARVVETNKGGLTVSVNGIRGFMPISQIELFRVEDTQQYVNQKLLCAVTEVDPVEKNLVVSRRDLLERERAELRDKLWASLAEGQVLEGVVTRLQSFGAFVDLGGVDGLLPVSELSWTRVKHPEEVVQPGQRVKVSVLHVDREARRVRLGLKQLTTGPWDEIDAKFPVGSVHAGKVTLMKDFGAFVELEPGLEGLVHISELASHRVQRVGQVVQLGQEVKVQVLDIDKERKRISLSMKAAAAKEVSEQEEAEEEAAPEKPQKARKPRTTPLKGGTGQGGGNLIDL